MHWADRIADELIAERPDTEVFTCASGISPSGSIHVGNLRDVATILFVGTALRERGKQVRLLHSWDDYDRLRKIPQPKVAEGLGLPQWLVERARSNQLPEDFAQHLGKPLARVPDPTGKYSSFAERNETEFATAIAECGIDVEYRYQTRMYESGVYRQGIIDAVRARREIYDILQKSKTEKGTADDREAYLPITVYCEQCGHETARISLEPGSDTKFHYTCGRCGADVASDLEVATNVKLSWRVDWAMRWRHENVIFEPAGKDHASAGGSYDSSGEICRVVFRHEPPRFQPYEFIGIRGLTGKMSSSTGLLLTPHDILDIYQPEVMLWMYARVGPMKVFDVALDDQVLRTYDEYDRALGGNPQIDTDVRALALANPRGRTIHAVPFRQLTGFAGIVQGNIAAMERMFARIGTPFSASEFSERLEKAETWLERYVPEQRITILDEPNVAFAATLGDEERAWVQALRDWLATAGDFSTDEATEVVYEIPKLAGLSEKEQGPRQRRFFQVVYNLVFGRDRGPRLGTFLAAVPRERYAALLDA